MVLSCSGDSGVACFLNAIGARNAASLRFIPLAADRCDVGRYQFQLMRNLLQRHVPGLRCIRAIVNSRADYKMGPTDFDKGKMTYRFVWSSLDKEEDFKQLCRTLANLVRGGLSFKVVPDLEARPEYLEELFQLVKERRERKAPRLGKERGKKGRATKAKATLRFIQRRSTQPIDHGSGSLSIGGRARTRADLMLGGRDNSRTDS